MNIQISEVELLFSRRQFAFFSACSGKGRVTMVEVYLLLCIDSHIVNSREMIRIIMAYLLHGLKHEKSDGRRCEDWETAGGNCRSQFNPHQMRRLFVYNSLQHI